MNRRSNKKASGINLKLDIQHRKNELQCYLLFSLYLFFFLFLKNEIYNVIQHEKNLSTQIISILNFHLQHLHEN